MTQENIMCARCSFVYWFFDNLWYFIITFKNTNPEIDAVNDRIEKLENLIEKKKHD